jgi:RNA polymerase sigma-70 factor, ECF subfamily
VDSRLTVAFYSGDSADTDQLLQNAAAGEPAAIDALLERYRPKLRRMIALRLDERLAARLDASDVVQEALADAARKLADYARDRPIPFYPWLHRLAAERLVAAHRRHRRSQTRSVAKEEPNTFYRQNSSTDLLVNTLIAGGTTPQHAMIREELCQRLHEALQALATTDREILMMHYLEELSFPEIAAILGIREGAAKMRHLRALQRIRARMAGDGSELGP